MEEVKKIVPKGMVVLPEKDQKWIICKSNSYVQKFVSKKLKNKYTFYAKSPNGIDRPLLIKYQEDIDELLSTDLFVEVKKIDDAVEEVVTEIENDSKPVEKELVEVEVESEPDYNLEQLEKLKSKALKDILKGLTDDPVPKSKYDKINLILDLQK